ncbi:hypothetical protein FQR65_LT20825 [Abscondita terminalis]|nr:hypothetical protein FQR65_LT20825 [Abscondita terminalis]
MPQATCSPQRPARAVQRTGRRSVPFMRQRLPWTSWAARRATVAHGGELIDETRRGGFAARRPQFRQGVQGFGHGGPPGGSGGNARACRARVARGGTGIGQAWSGPRYGPGELKVKVWNAARTVRARGPRMPAAARKNEGTRCVACNVADGAMQQTAKKKHRPRALGLRRRMRWAMAMGRDQPGWLPAADYSSDALLQRASVLLPRSEPRTGASVDDLGLDFLAPVGRQAVHEQGIGACGGHHLGVHAPVGEGLLAGLVLGLVAHAGPHVGGDQVGALAGVQRVLEDLVAALARRLAAEGQRLVDLVAAGRADMDREAQQVGRLQPGVGHVVAIADPGDGLALDRAAVLDEGEDVGQDLAGMELVGQAVDDGHARVLGKAHDLVLAVGADHHQVGHAADDARAVLDGLGAAQLAVARGQVDHRAAELVHAGLEAHAGARAGLLEDHGQRAVAQRVVLLVVLELLLDQGRAFEQVGVLVGREVGKLEIVLDGGHGQVLHSDRNCTIRGLSLATTSSASASVMISGGTRRTTVSAVTLNSRPASAPRPSSAPQGLASSMPDDQASGACTSTNAFDVRPALFEASFRWSPTWWVVLPAGASSSSMR